MLVSSWLYQRFLTPFQILHEYWILFEQIPFRLRSLARHPILLGPTKATNEVL